MQLESKHRLFCLVDLGRLIKKSDKEIYQNSSKKRPQKNYSGGFGDYCCIPGCQSAF